MQRMATKQRTKAQASGKVRPYPKAVKRGQFRLPHEDYLEPTVLESSYEGKRAIDPAYMVGYKAVHLGKKRGQR